MSKSRAKSSTSVSDSLSFLPADYMMSDQKKVDDDANEVDSILNKDVLGMNYNSVCFGTKEAPAVVQSLYNRIIVGCPGGAGEGHDMVWFWLEKDKPHECVVCSQFFKLEVVGIGG